ncbi:MAG: T9SS type A sorting domain-containing protein, partial [Flavobacterium sp.]|nr:T9SS type A sorting domain-containing protein [Flavobacterium sp.]
PPATSNSATLTVNKADATIIVTGYTGVYDGNAHGASGTATGVAGADLSAGLNFGSSFTDVPGGTANWTFTGGTNYNDANGSVAINISKADAVINVIGYTGVYDGNAHSVSGTATGVASEDLSAGLNFGSSFTDVPGGTTNWTFSGGTNYNDANGSVSINISKADAVISVIGYTGVYDGNAHGASGTATGVASEDLSAGLNFGSSFTDVPGGTANWTFSGGTNYNNASGSVAISIEAKAVTVTAEAKSKIFGDPDPEFTYLLSEALVAGNALNGDLSRASGESAGNYAINQGDLSVNTGNYSISFVTADLTIIMPPPMSATVAKTNITCNGANDGTITITNPTGGLGIYEYRLNSGVWQASGNFTDLTAGTYNVQMRDPVRTIFSADLGNQTIVEPGVLNAQTSKTNVTCNGAANGSITILNPTGGSGSYEYRLNSDAWQSSPVFSGLAANTYTISMRDAVNQSCTKSLGSLTISEPQALSAVCSNSNNLLYFGYAGDQTSTINVKPSGGVGPYKVSITMNRPLKCNVVNNTGDEVWVPGLSTASNVDTGCPSSGTPSLLPISTSTFTINATVGYSLNVTLMADATFTATITDSNGCITTCTTTILAEDVRCFSGNSTRPKVNICHKTGSTKNPCVSICVDDNAVAEHLAHGDFLGKCTSNCLDPNGTRSLEDETFNIKAYPNPSNSVFNLEIENGSEEEVAIEVFDISGRRIKQLNPIDIHAITFGEELPRGVYLVNVQQGSNSKTIRVVKE